MKAIHDLRLRSWLLHTCSPQSHFYNVSVLFSFDRVNDFCIINTASNELDLLIHESLLILRDRPMLNQENSSIPLCLF